MGIIHVYSMKGLYWLRIFAKFPSLLDLPRNRLDEVFIKFLTLEGAVTVKSAAITTWRLKQ